LSFFPKLETGISARALPVLTTAPFALTDSTFPTTPPFLSKTGTPAFTSAAVAAVSVAPVASAAGSVEVVVVVVVGAPVASGAVVEVDVVWLVELCAGAPEAGSVVVVWVVSVDFCTAKLPASSDTGAVVDLVCIVVVLVFAGVSGFRGDGRAAKSERACNRWNP
jgi:hypothetical protein